MIQRVYSIFAILFLTASTVLAQADDESPYSSSTVDAPPGDNFFNTYGLIIICGLVFVGLLIFVLLRGRRRA